MPLQNRVTPFGDIVAVAARGMFTGNRGIIHDPATKTLLKRRWSSPAWITCVCEFRDRRRDVMATRSWTELFFLDEATALAAGHRPCYYCRRADALRFADAFARGNGLSRVSAKEIDATLHRERIDGKGKRLHALPCRVDELPEGATVAGAESGDGEGRDGSFIRNAYLVMRGGLLRWSFDGYQPVEQGAIKGLQDRLSLLTPPSTLRALEAGYQPALHPSARTT